VAEQTITFQGEIHEAAFEIVKHLTDRGHKAYYAGGCVRDRIMGLQPQDIDIATDASPQQIISYFPRTVAVGEQFGVVLVLKGTNQFEVATFRSDGAYSNGRHPDEVAFCGAQEDVLRRDFTINGLLYDPHTETVLDYVSGIADIRNRMIRCIGEPVHRFKEDSLRLIRGVRFAARFGFEIEPWTFIAMRILRETIHRVSAERKRDELTKILTKPNAAQGFRLLDETGLLKELLPEVHAMKGVVQSDQYHPEGDVWMHTLLMLQQLREPSIAFAWATLLHDVGKPATFEWTPEKIRFHRHNAVGAEMAESICRRLKMKNSDIELIRSLVAGHMKFVEAKKMRLSTLKKFLSQSHFDRHMALHRLDCIASHGNLEIHRFCIEQLEHLSTEQLAPSPLINGHDLIQLGYTPGPIFQQILAHVSEAQLEEKIETREQALELVRKHFPR